MKSIAIILLTLLSFTADAQVRDPRKVKVTKDFTDTSHLALSQLKAYYEKYKEVVEIQYDPGKLLHITMKSFFIIITPDRRSNVNQLSYYKFDELCDL